MSKVLDFTDVDKFCPGGFLQKRKDTSPILSLGNYVDVYFLPRKRSRVCAPFIITQEQKKRQPSIEVLPDECLFEVFRRLPADGQERSACARVSKRWLMLLSSIRREEICTSDDTAEPEEKCEFIENESHGYLSRCLEGKNATDVRLAAIAVGTACRGGLGKLSIRGTSATRKLTDAGLKAISCGCPSLRHLSLWNLSSIGDEGVCRIASRCASLEKLDISSCPAIADKGLISIAMNCPKLMSVTLESCSNIGNEGLQALGRYCPNLKCITVKNCPLIGDQGIASLFSSAGHIMAKARLEALNISDVSLAVIGHYGSAMTDLSLIGLPNVNERGFWVMGKGQGLQKLKSLLITACPGVSDLGLEAVGKGCPDLKLFTLRKCPQVSDTGIVSFTKAAADSLESLQLEECHKITQCGVFGILTNCGGKFKALALANCLSLRDLGLVFPPASPCHSLHSLMISNCPGFGDGGLGMFVKLCPKLTHLDLSGLHSITDAGLLPLVQNSEAGLVKANLSGCVSLTDNAVTAIAKINGKTLNLLNIDGCKSITDMSLKAIATSCLVLSELDVSMCGGITDTGIAVLAAVSQFSLQIFSLAGCSLVSDKSFLSLAVLGRTLVGLNIQHCTGISSLTVDQLQDQLWKCDILS